MRCADKILLFDNFFALWWYSLLGACVCRHPHYTRLLNEGEFSYEIEVNNCWLAVFLLAILAMPHTAEAQDGYHRRQDERGIDKVIASGNNQLPFPSCESEPHGPTAAEQRFRSQRELPMLT